MRRLNKSYPYVKQLKNRSSKQNVWLSGPGFKPIMHKVSTEQVRDWTNREVPGAFKELERRQKKSEAKKNK